MTQGKGNNISYEPIHKIYGNKKVIELNNTHVLHFFQGRKHK